VPLPLQLIAAVAPQPMVELKSETSRTVFVEMDNKIPQYAPSFMTRLIGYEYIETFPNGDCLFECFTILIKHHKLGSPMTVQEMRDHIYELMDPNGQILKAIQQQPHWDGYTPPFDDLRQNRVLLKEAHNYGTPMYELVTFISLTFLRCHLFLLLIFKSHYL